MPTPHRGDAGRYRRVGLRLAVLSVLAACAAAAAEPDGLVGTAWVGRNSNGGFQLFELGPDNGLLVLQQGDSSGRHGTWREEGGGIVMEAGDGRLRYDAELVDGRLVGSGGTSDGSWQTEFVLDQDAHCAGRRQLCGGQVFCLAPRGRRSLRPIPGLTAAADGGDDIGALQSAFTCAVRLGLTGAYVERIRFPLTVTEIANDSSISRNFYRLDDKVTTQRSVDRADFTVDDIRSRPPLYPWSQTVPTPFVPEGGAALVTYWDSRPSLWTFEPIGGRWTLTASASCRGDSCLAALLCGAPYRERAYPGRGADGDEDFDAFYESFYCAAKGGREDMVLSRMRFPLPYTAADTEATSANRLRREEFELYYITSGDGSEQPPVLAVDGDEASAFIDWVGTGVANTVYFTRIDGLWYATAADFASY